MLPVYQWSNWILNEYAHEFHCYSFVEIPTLKGDKSYRIDKLCIDKKKMLYDCLYSMHAILLYKNHEYTKDNISMSSTKSIV